MAPFPEGVIVRRRRPLWPVRALLSGSLLLAPIALSAACARSEAPLSPSAASVTSLDVRKGRDTINQTYAVWGGDAGYLTGAILTITTSAGTESYVASGPHAQVKAPVPASDTSVHIVISYPGVCFDRDVAVKTSRSPGQNSGTWLYPERC